MTASNPRLGRPPHPRPHSRPAPSSSTSPSSPAEMKRTIRLLRIPPAPASNAKSPLQTRPHTFPLTPSGKGCPAYAVLSYTRRPRDGPGALQPSGNVQVGDTTISVPAQVSSALLQLRDSRARWPRQPWFVWVDCLCEDSSSDSSGAGDEEGVEDDAERVKQRRAVLRGAEAVYVWLGREEGMGDGRGGGFGGLNGDVEMLGGLLGCEYWGRMESVIDVMLGREVVVLRGDERVRWRVLEGMVERMEERGVGGLVETWGYRIFTARREFRSRIEGDGVPFVELWEAFSGWECEVRDKALALLTVSGEELGSHCLEGREGDDDFAGTGHEETQMDVDEDATVGDSYSVLDGPGLLRLDESALATLAHRFDMVMEHITLELNSLVEECNMTVGSYGTFGRALGNVDAEVARFQGLLQRMDDLELELDRVLQIRDIVRGFRMTMEEEMDLLDARVDFGAAGG